VIVESARPRHYVGFGLLCGLAFLCKDGLGLLPLAVLALLPVRISWRRHAVGLGLAAFAAAVVLLPPSLYIAYRFPVEALLEQQHRVAHLVRDVEGWKRPLDYYATVFFPRVTSPLVAGVAYLAVGFGIAARRRLPHLGVLSIWIATYLVVLSLSVSKISNFIYPVMPAVYLLLSGLARELWRTGLHLFVLAASASIIATAFLLQWEVLGSAAWLMDSAPWQTRPALIAIQWGIFAAVAASAALVRAPEVRAASLAGVIIAMSLVLLASVRASAAAMVARPRDHERQLALREAARAAKAVLHSEDVVLVDWPGVRKSHLYVMYWSGLESYDITAKSSFAPPLSQLPADRRVFLLRDSHAAPGPDGIRLTSGSLLRLR
jgi:hypothetical protein